MGFSLYGVELGPRLLLGTARYPSPRVMLDAIAAAPDPSHAFNRFADIIERVPSAINLYRLLEAEPTLARLLADTFR